MARLLGQQLKQREFNIAAPLPSPSTAILIEWATAARATPKPSVKRAAFVRAEPRAWAAPPEVHGVPGFKPTTLPGAARPFHMAHMGRNIVRKLFRGGLLVLKDMFIDDTGVGPEPGALFGLTMLLHTAEGRSYGGSELASWLRTAGFPELEHVAMVDQGYALLIAR